MATKPKLKNKKKIYIPKGTESITVTFRVSKGKPTKKLRKVNIPRPAQQVALSFGKKKGK